MKINIIENKPKKLILEFSAGDLTIPDLIATYLTEQTDVIFAGIEKNHPEIGKPLLILKTSSKKPIDVLNKALDELKESYTELKKEIEKIK